MLFYLNNKNRYYFLLLGSIVFHSFISFENITFDLYFNSIYREYGLFFKSFDFSVFSRPSLTFPVWGYGIFHLIGENILINLFLQQLLTFLTLVYMDKEIIRYQVISKIKFFRLLILISAPWFLFHTQMWPKSFASNILILSLLFLCKFFKTKKFIYLVISAITFGIVQNFRSDYIYLFYVFSLLILISKPFGLLNFIKKLLFPLIVIIFLAPWMIFTYHQTGKPLLTSTNAGHVLFIGLGQLPNNKWEITPFDDDKHMAKILKNNYGENYKSDEFNENNFLKKEFLKRIKEYPFEWINKCFFAFRLLLLDPFYVGNIGSFQQNQFSNVQEIRKLESYIYSFKFKEAKELVFNTNWKFTNKEVFQFIYTLYSKCLGILLFFSFLITFILSIYKFGLNLFKDKIILLLSLTVVYQISISVFAFHMPVYNTTIYIVYLLLTYLLFQKYLSIRQ